MTSYWIVIIMNDLEKERLLFIWSVIWKHTMIIIEAIFVFNCVTLPIFLWFMIFFPASSSVFNFIYTYPILFLFPPCFSFSPSFFSSSFSLLLPGDVNDPRLQALREERDGADEVSRV